MAQQTTDCAEIKKQLERIVKGLGDECGLLRTAEDYKIGLILESGAEIIAEFNEFSTGFDNAELIFYYAISETSDICDYLKIITEDYAEYYDHECLKNNQQPQKVRFSNAADLEAIADILEEEDIIRHPGTTSWE